MLPLPVHRRTRKAFLPPPPLFLRPVFPHFQVKHARTARPVPCATLDSPPVKQYVPLHVHSDFSLLDGASQLPNLVSRAAELGVPALALTDHGVLYGAIELLRECKHTPVKPIIGNEMYIVNDVPGRPLQKGDRGPKKYHLIVLAKNTIGYRNLVKLTTMAHLNGKVGKGIFARPSVNKAQLFQHREGLIVSSACLGGEIPQAILNGQLETARSIAAWYRDVFGDDFYLEIQDHGSKEDKIVNPEMVKISKELGIKVIATNDSHFTSCLDAEAHDALICIQTGKLLTDENRLHYAGNEYFKSVDEMRENFVDHLSQSVIDEALQNTLQVAEKVDQYDLFGETRIPDFPIPEDFTGSHDDYLSHNAHKSLRERLTARKDAGLADPKLEEQYYDRLNLELDMIAKMGFSSYFLVVWDYIKHAKELNIPVGPGRGSAAGSLVAFALRITDVDPIPFNLLFERFLNPERKSMPDIDTDFSVEGRERIISYVSDRYGSDHVAQIITFNRLTSKAVLKDVARVHSVPYSDADRLAKLIPVVRGKPAPLSNLLSEETPSKDFKKIVERNPAYRTWIDKAMRIEGTNKTFGIHAAGVVISAMPLTDAVPLSTAKHGETITQYSMEDVESLGLLKMDFLGLKNLTVIETALSFINDGRKREEKDNLDFSVDTLPLDDAETYKLLCEGELDGIFQLDASAGMRSIVRELRPSSLEDISSILALYRPGPLDAGLIPKFIRRKHGVESIEYDHPLLEPILRETYGIMVYQEQIMRIARDLAGYSLGQADILRRAMGKKKTKDMERERPRFINGAKQRGVPESKATELFDMMIKFAEYCFNKSHSTAYAYLTYQTAYLKANYPVEYAAALLRSNMNQSDKLVRYLADANVSGVQVLPPSVNKSELGFTVDRTDPKKPVVLFGLEAVKTVGASVSKALLTERQARGRFHSILDLAERVDLRVLNKRAMGALILAGAFDELHQNRKVLHEQLENLLMVRRKLRDKRKRREKKELSEEEKEAFLEEDRLAWEEIEMELAEKSKSEPDFSFLERLAGEKATMGFYASGHPLYDLHEVRRVLDCTRVDHLIGDSSQEDTQNSEVLNHELSKTAISGSEVIILSCITELKKMTTAKGKKMAKWNIEDAGGRVAGIVFPGAYEIVEQLCPKKSEEQRISDGVPVAAVSETTETTAISSAEQGSTAEDEEFVVQEDARVIVWGKVDHESSGTTQVIIDDVQRVDDVQAIVATAVETEQRYSSANILILRRSAAEVLGVTTSAPSSTTYIDSNGEKRKRWPKKTVLAEKCRIPLILKSVDGNGEVISYENAGNNLRFPSDYAELLQALEKRSGFSMEIISIKSDVMDMSGGIEFDDLVVSEEEKAPSLPRDTELVEDFIEENALTTTEDVYSTDVVQELGVRVQTSSLLGESEAKMSIPITEDPSWEQENIPDSDWDTTVVTDSDVKEESQNEPEPIEEMKHKSDAPTRMESLVEKPNRVVGKVSLNAAQQEEHQALFEVLRHSLTNRDNSKSPVLTWKERLAQARAEPHRTMIEREVTEENIDSGVSTVNTAIKESNRVNQSELAFSNDVSNSREGTMASLQQERGNFSSTQQVVSRQESVSSFPEYATRRHDTESCRSDLSRPSQSTDTDENFRWEKNEALTRSDNSVNTNGSHLDDPLADHVSLTAPELKYSMKESVTQPLWNSENVPNEARDNEGFASSRSSVPTVEVDIGPVMDLSNGMEMNFNDGFSALLDMVCLVAGDVAQLYTKTHVQFEALSGMDVVKITEENIVLNVSGQVAFVDQHRIFVLVEVKENTATGTRKRPRSIGNVAVSFTTNVVLEPIVIKTKKAKKLVEVTRAKLEDASSSCTDASNRAVVLGKDPQSTSCYEISENMCGSNITTDSTYDGGELLRWMSRAALVGAEHVLKSNGDFQIVMMDNGILTNLSALKDDASVNLRVNVEGVSSGSVVVRVEIEALGSSDDCRIGTGRFWMRSMARERLKNHVFQNEDKPLFSFIEVADMFKSLAKALVL